MRKTAGTAAILAAAAVLSACGGGGDTSSDGRTVLHVAALEGGYGADMYTQVAEAYEALNPDIDVQLDVSKTIEDELTPNMAAGDYPDLVVLGQGREAALTETMIRNQSLTDLSGVLDITVPGEDQTVGDKLVDGVVGGLGTNPYGDDKTYLMPMYYSPTGLVYDQGLFDRQGWTVPATFDEMNTLGEQARAQGISLFTYPTAGYMDSWFFSLIATVGGEDFYNDVMTYQPGVWETPEATEVLNLTADVLRQASPTTVGYANQQDFTKNQQSILEDQALFMPNGTWISGEMADAPRADGFQWGLSPLPAAEADGQQYITTSIEAAWIPTGAEHVDEAEQFLAYLYSDEATGIFAQSNAIQPVKGSADNLTGDLANFYAVYDNPNVRALVGGFASSATVPGVDIKKTLFDSANSIISGDLTVEQWQVELSEANDALAAASTD